jgi:hypothetical protein
MWGYEERLGVLEGKAGKGVLYPEFWSRRR